MSAPTNPIPPGERGQALAIAAYAITALTGVEMRLHWCVDLMRDVGFDADETIDPSDPMAVETKWGQYLQRFHKALDLQPWDGCKCKLGLTVRYTSPSTKERQLIVFAIPWFVNVVRLGRGNPPVGAWRLVALPPHQQDRLGREIPDRCEGDYLPASFWYDGIPF